VFTLAPILFNGSAIALWTEGWEVLSVEITITVLACERYNFSEVTFVVLLILRRTMIF
jgi:hypothetical protein